MEPDTRPDTDQTADQQSIAPIPTREPGLRVKPSPEQKAAETALAHQPDAKELQFLRYYLGIDPPPDDHRLQGNILGSMTAAGYDRGRNTSDVIRQGHRIIRRTRVPLEACLASLDVDGHTLAVALAEGLQASTAKEYIHQATGQLIAGASKPDMITRHRYISTILQALGHTGKRSAPAGLGPVEDYTPPPRPARGKVLFSEGEDKG